MAKSIMGIVILSLSLIVTGAWAKDSACVMLQRSPKDTQATKIERLDILISLANDPARLDSFLRKRIAATRCPINNCADENGVRLAITHVIVTAKEKYKTVSATAQSRQAEVDKAKTGLLWARVARMGEIFATDERSNNSSKDVVNAKNTLSEAQNKLTEATINKDKTATEVAGELQKAYERAGYYEDEILKLLIGFYNKRFLGYHCYDPIWNQ